MDPLVDLLDRQAAFLLRQTDSQALLIQVEAFLRALQNEPLLAAYLDDILQEVAEIVGVMEEEDARLSSELVLLRQELVQLRPGADDSQTVAPRDAGPWSTGELAQYRGTLAFFDEFAGADASPFNADGEGGRAKTLLSILQRKDAAYLLDPQAGTAEPDALERWRKRLWNVQRRYDHALRMMRTQRTARCSRRFGASTWTRRTTGSSTGGWLICVRALTGCGRTCTVASARLARGWRSSSGSGCDANGTTANG